MDKKRKVELLRDIVMDNLILGLVTFIICICYIYLKDLKDIFYIFAFYMSVCVSLAGGIYFYILSNFDNQESQTLKKKMKENPSDYTLSKIFIYLFYFLIQSLIYIPCILIIYFIVTAMIFYGNYMFSIITNLIN